MADGLPKRKRIAFLDDEPIELAVWASQLTNLGFDIDLHTTIDAFLRFLSSDTELDAIVIDIESAVPRYGGPPRGAPPGAENSGDLGTSALMDILSSRETSGIPTILVSHMFHPDIWRNREIESKLLRGRNNVFFASKATGFGPIVTILDSLTRDDLREPVFSFSAVVTLEKKVSDGTLVRLIEPLYSEIVQSIMRHPHRMNEINPRQWEELVAATYLKAGFDDVVLTPRSGDLGRDIIAIKRGFWSVKFIEQVKAYSPGHVVTADEVRALLGVLVAEQDASKAIFTTTSYFAPRLRADRLLKPFLPHRLELIDRQRLIDRLAWSGKSPPSEA